MSFDRHLADIAREFPQWTIWRSDAGRWWATRHQPLSDAQRDAGFAMTIDADDPAALREQLREQESKDDEDDEDDDRAGDGRAGPADP